jgi:hypothetical protein
MNYWVFQGNKKYFNFEQAINDNVLDCWNVRFFRKEVNIGDKIIIWLAGKDGGLAALASISALGVIPKDEYCFTKKGKEKKANYKKNLFPYYVGLQFFTPINLFLNPIQLPENLKLLLPVGKRGQQNVNYRDKNLAFLEIEKILSH